MPTKSPHQISTNSPINIRLLMILLAVSIIVAVAVLSLWGAPQKIITGEKGQKAIKMLDEMRRPLLSIKSAHIKTEEENTEVNRKELSATIEVADVLVEEYLVMAQYNQELLQSVAIFKNEYEKWAHNLQHYHFTNHASHSHPEMLKDKADQYLESSRSFLKIMTFLGDGEGPIHNDIDEGRSATRLVAFLMAVIIITQIITFVSQIIIKNSKLNSARKNLEDEIDARSLAQEKIALLVDKTPGVIYSCKYDGQRNFIPTYCTPNVKEMMGYSPEDFYNHHELWANNIHHEDVHAVFENYERLFKENRLLQRYRWQHKNGQYLWVRDEITLVRDESGEPDHIVGVWVNIDEQKAVEEELESHQKQLEESIDNLTLKNLEISKVLDEKDILFKELHHRVKNNMQVISALLSMQAMKCDSDEVIEELSKGKDRIDSMALVHELLYQTDDMARVDLTKYINELGQMLLDTHQEILGGVSISVDGETCLLLADSIVPLGLILNELFTNSFKHGLQGVTDGQIKISCLLNDEGQLVVHYSDNGKGLPAKELSSPSNALGLNLIRNLSRQLDADIKIYNEKGMHFNLVAAIK